MECEPEGVIDSADRPKRLFVIPSTLCSAYTVTFGPILSVRRLRSSFFFVKGNAAVVSRVWTAKAASCQPPSLSAKQHTKGVALQYEPFVDAVQTMRCDT